MGLILISPGTPFLATLFIYTRTELATKFVYPDVTAMRVQDSSGENANLRGCMKPWYCIHKCTQYINCSLCMDVCMLCIVYTLIRGIWGLALSLS